MEKMGATSTQRRRRKHILVWEEKEEESHLHISISSSCKWRETKEDGLNTGGRERPERCGMTSERRRRRREGRRLYFICLSR